MPTFFANALLSFWPDRSLSVRLSARVGVVSPMFNEEAGAAAALGSLLEQSEPFDELAVSVNGGSDDTLAVVRQVLAEHGFAKVYEAPAPDFTGSFERWHLPGGPAAVVLSHDAPISKADSINHVVAGGYLTCDRVLVVDGDTIFAPTYLEKLKDHFHRLKRERHGGGWRYVIEDSAIQSGAVTSLPPGAGRPMAGFISRARAGEYAVATLLRVGQTARPGSGRLFGRSRLYTVVGCGFAARRESFPMPSDTLTEDHDFTLHVQNEEVTEEPLSLEEARRSGLRVVVGGNEVDAADFFGPRDRLVMRRTGNARFVTGALMYTEDPLDLPGYMRQVERWNGGGVENAVKRARRPLRRALKPNVAFAAGAAQFENLGGLLFLLLVLPVLLGINSALPGYRMGLQGVALWLGLDLALTLLLVGLGFHRLWRAQGERGWRLAGRVAASTSRSVLPFMAFRPLNILAYVVAITRVLPAALRRKELDARVTITWERPRAAAKRQVSVRSATVALSLMLTGVSMFAGAYFVAYALRPGYKDTWLMINAAAPLHVDDHGHLPLQPVMRVVEPPAPGHPAVTLEYVGGASAEDAAALEVAGVDAAALEGDPWEVAPMVVAFPADAGAAAASAPSPGPEASADLSVYCSVGFTAAPAPQRRALAGDADAYLPLTYWQRLVLARLSPLAAHVEEAATAYDVPARLLLQVLINESFLDPLAEGPTEDLGLSQVTGDALTLLREISSQPRSAFANAHLFGGPFNVFDPDFSICAGASKLAWARAQPGGQDDHYAYARYINPLEGVRRNGLNPVHAELVLALDELAPLADALRHAFAAYERDRSAVTEQERALLDVYRHVSEGRLTIRTAYLEAHSLVKRFGIDDGAFYDEVAEKLYGIGTSTAALPDGR